MKEIPDAYKKVPMMFRAQAPGRSQLQYIDPDKTKKKEKQDVHYWVDEWTDKAELIAGENARDIETETFQAKSYEISWRFITNGGQDDGILRPVIGASGIPFYPGSSMKGAFRQACEKAEDAGEIPAGTCNLYCGNESEITPGLLRFHGAYPTNDWTERLLDLVHPQQGWQVMTRETHKKPKGESAYAQVSLYQPTLRFAISCDRPLTPDKWREIWQIWEGAIASGLGSKVSTGYGQINKTTHPIIYRATLKGKGPAAKLIDGNGEFRPNIFRGALRGHALRIFGGLTESETAKKLVEELFGDIQNKDATVGLLGFQFKAFKLEIKDFSSGKYTQPAYQVEGELTWFFNRPLDDPEKIKILKQLVAKLMQFAMIFGGFGKSWRRVDHRQFFKRYYEDDPDKGLIGCHWEWWGDNSKRRNVQVKDLARISHFIEKVRQIAREWIQSQNQPLQNAEWADNWREAWHPSRVQVWGRIADDAEDSVAIKWFHAAYQTKILNHELEKSIYQSSVTGTINVIGRIWHRMYPVILLQKNPDEPKKPKVKPTCRYLELITIFPDDSKECDDFLQFLNTNPENFEKLWGE